MVTPGLPGTARQATIMLSLWDEIHSLRRAFALRSFVYQLGGLLERD